MTRDEIIAMPAGKKINALIADIMGWNRNHKINECEDGFYDYCIYCGYEPRFEEVEPGTCDGFPEYSKDIEAAWQVIEKLAKDGGAPVVAFEATGKWSCGSWFSGQTKATMAYAETAPLAISRAALLTTIREND